MTSPRVINRMELGEELARAMEPEAWAAYDEGNGRCANMDGWKVLRTIEHTRAVLDVLATKGAISVPPRRTVDKPEDLSYPEGINNESGRRTMADMTDKEMLEKAGIMNGAFADAAAEYRDEGNEEMASKLEAAHDGLPLASLARLHDILMKVR